ncbi:MAG: hypothetical protein QGH15_08225 [Kiritimatiellia bacterium]|jgi:hypothetical protein|nr:hypothetical protein [Kiritimatiellia bacterium]
MQKHSAERKSTRLAAIVPLLAAAALFAVSLPALANTENTFPYAESFELHQDGEDLVGTNGWYSGDPLGLTATAESYTYSGDLPFPDATHSNVAAFDAPTENRFTGTDGPTKAYVDFMLKPVLGDEPENIATTATPEYGLYFNKAGHIVIYHGEYDWEDAGGGYPFSQAWTELSHTPVSTSEFSRVRITIDYKTFENPYVSGFYMKLFQVELNGTLLTHADGYQVPGFVFPPPPDPSELGGSWFFCSDSDNFYAADKLDGFGMQGVGTIDDLLISDSTNIPTHDLTIASTHAEAQGEPDIPSSGSYNYGEQVLCSVTNSPVAVGATTQLVCTGWSSGTGTVSSTGSESSVLVTMNEDSGLTWEWGYRYLLDTEAGAGGSVSLGDGWYDAGAGVTITAQPNPSMVFDGWTGDVPAEDVNENPLTLTIDQARSILANFTSEGPTEEYTSHGTPYSWLDDHCPTGTVVNHEVADLEDWDGDGALNWEEHPPGTLPNDSNSVFTVLDVLYTPGSNMVSWYGTTNFGMTNSPFSMYRMTGDLPAGAWQLIESNSIERAPSGTNEWWDDSPPAGVPAYYHPAILWDAE